MAYWRSFFSRSYRNEVVTQCIKIGRVYGCKLCKSIVHCGREIWEGHGIITDIGIAGRKVDQRHTIFLLFYFKLYMLGIYWEGVVTMSINALGESKDWSYDCGCALSVWFLLIWKLCRARLRVFPFGRHWICVAMRLARITWVGKPPDSEGFCAAPCTWQLRCDLISAINIISRNRSAVE